MGDAVSNRKTAAKATVQLQWPEHEAGPLDVSHVAGADADLVAPGGVFDCTQAVADELLTQPHLAVVAVATAVATADMEGNET